MEILRRAVRYLLAIKSVQDKSRQLSLTKSQEDQLRERGATERNAAESALLKLYLEVWLPKADNGGIGIERVAVGGRPLQQTLDANPRARITGRWPTTIGLLRIQRRPEPALHSLERTRQPRRSSGKVTISVAATNEEGFDQSKLQNGVLEPLREIKLID